MAPLSSCQMRNNKADEKEVQADILSEKELFFKISLAQWSLHRALEKQKIKAEDFAAIAKNEFDINAIEYVNGFYKDHANDSAYFRELDQRAKDLGVTNLLVMVDEEGHLGDPNDANRKLAVENHYKWVEAAKILDCHSIRVNAFGKGSRSEVRSAVVDGLGRLSEYASEFGINVLIENHGNFSSDGKWMADVLSQVGLPNCGSLPDFGNFCVAREWGSTMSDDCPDVYDRYLGVSEMMPFAKAVSAKSYDFDSQGFETKIDYFKMMKIVKESGFKGYVGIEYEGNRLTEPEGINATKELLLTVGSKLTG